MAKRRSFLGREDATDAEVPEPYHPPDVMDGALDEAPPMRSGQHDMALPPPMEGQIPGFFEWDGDDGLEEPPTEDAPNPPMLDPWTEEYPTPIDLPEPPLMGGILDPTASLPPARSQSLKGPSQDDTFQGLFNTAPQPRQRRTVAGLVLSRLVAFVGISIGLGLALGGGLAYFLFVYDSGPEALAPPASFPVQKELNRAEPAPQK
jgi:hypothetical protein